MKRKLIALALSLSVAAAAFTACANSDENSEECAVAETTEATEVTETAEETPEETGNTTTLQSSQPDNYPKLDDGTYIFFILILSSSNF